MEKTVSVIILRSDGEPMKRSPTLEKLENKCDDSILGALGEGGGANLRR